MMEEGYKRTKRILSAVFSDGVDNFDTVYQRINEINSVNSKKVTRLTGDVIVTNMNKILKKFIRNKRILEGGVWYE